MLGFNFVILGLSMISASFAFPSEEENKAQNEVIQTKNSPYVRTFTRYHHRRNIHTFTSDLDYDWQDSLGSSDKILNKRHVDAVVPNSKDLIDIESVLNSDERSLDSYPNKIVDKSHKNAIYLGKTENSALNKVEPVTKGYKVKAAIVYTESPTTRGPRRICLHKTNKVAYAGTVKPAVTLSVDDARYEDTVDSEVFDAPGPSYETVLPSGERTTVEECSDGSAKCYTLWLSKSNGNISILGQGCWKASMDNEGVGCDMCTNAKNLPRGQFCCCTGDYCNANFSSAQLYVPVKVPKAKAAVQAMSNYNYYRIAALMVLTLVAILAIGMILKKIHALKRPNKEEVSDGMDFEKDALSGGPDSLATGLLCVDNLTLIEHIGQGKFGSVWSGSLGSTPVAVKMYLNTASWQREASIYASLSAHPNLLRYYGSDTRPTLTEGGGRQQLVVLELCPGTLRQRLRATPLSWRQLATLGHGLASALAHMHDCSGSKVCVVHRDVNSNNVLVTADGQARLADLGLAQNIHMQPVNSRMTEDVCLMQAGTLRYQSPEALEGALDLAGARAALCAVDVFALGLVLWEMLWRCSGAHPGPTPPYALPYAHAGLHTEPTKAQMQALVSRGKARPPLPCGPVADMRALRQATDTCDECWDHDAEARLTAVCVQERLSELKQMLQVQGPVIYDNNLHSHPPYDGSPPSSSDTDKNSNCITSQTCDVMTPLLYSQPHIGRNACLERNTHTQIQNHAQLVHKSLKDIANPPPEAHRQNVEENCLSVARVSNHRNIVRDTENSDRLNEIRSFQRPLDYVPNDVSCQDIENRALKQTNLMQHVKIEKPKWGIKRFFERKLPNSKPLEASITLLPQPNLTNSTVISIPNHSTRAKTVVITACTKPSNLSNGRPSNLILNHLESDSRAPTYSFEGPCTLSPPNQTLSPTMMIESELNKSENKVFAFKELPHSHVDDRDGPKPPNQIFAVIVPKANCNNLHRDNSNLIEMNCKTARGSSESLNKNSVRTSESSQSLYRFSNSESEDSTVKKRLSSENKIITPNNAFVDSGGSSRASMDVELQYINGQPQRFKHSDSPSFDINSDCSSSSEDERLMLLSENGGSKITMQPIPKVIQENGEKRPYKNDVLKEASQVKVSEFGSFCNKYNPKVGYENFNTEFTRPGKENMMNGYSGDNPVYLAAVNGEIITDFKQVNFEDEDPKSPKPCLKQLAIKRQRSLEEVSELFSSASDVSLQKPAGRVKTPGDLPAAVRRARRDRALQRHAAENNRLSLYDDRMMFGNSL